MQDNFLNIYPKLSSTPAINQAQSAIAGLWLAHGDEPLLQQWFVDAIRAWWRLQNLAVMRIELVSTKTWQDVLTELNSLSLFDDASAVIVTGNHKPDKHTQAELERFALESNNGGNQSCLLWLTAKVDKRSQSSKWFAPFAKFGHVIDCNIYNENQRRQILNIHARQFGLDLTAEAWQFLTVQTENHLLSAYQALWRLSFLYTPTVYASSPHHSSEPDAANDQASKPPASFKPPSSHNTISPNTGNMHTLSHQDPSISNMTTSSPITIEVDALQDGLVSSAQYTSFDLSDAMLAGDATKVIVIFNQFKATDEPMPLVLWTLNKDMRHIMQLLDGKDAQSLGIWRSKQSLYRQACQRHNANSIKDWPELLYNCDKAVKGLLRQPAWELILQTALRVAGVRLFS